MLFSSLTFLFYFLPSLVLLYYILPRNFRNHLLLIASLLFFAYGGVSYSVILVLSILFNYFFVRQIQKSETRKKNWLFGGLVFNLGLIFAFKYLDFFISNINGVGAFFSNDFESIALLKIVMPLGISFFTFQQMSLLWDVYREPNGSRIRLLESALYISLFPQLIAGPIVRYKDIISQIKERTESFELFRSGIIRFVLGLFKKIVFSNSCAVIADSIMDSSIDAISTPVAWLGIVAYSLHIYFDFSGYSDMAIGLGRMFGFKILENFNFPYIATSIKDFWRRWHISLSTWFRDYVYIPLGGNRRGPYRMYLNLLVVFLLTGFWHGATWSFVVWGVFHGLFLILEKLGLESLLIRVPKLLSWSYAMLVVMLGWVFFRIEELPDALSYISKLFGGGQYSEARIVAYLNYESLTILLLALIFATGVITRRGKNLLPSKLKTSSALNLAFDVVIIGLFIFSVMYINSGSYNPFIYSRF